MNGTMLFGVGEVNSNGALARAEKETTRWQELIDGNESTGNDPQIRKGRIKWGTSQWGYT